MDSFQEKDHASAAAFDGQSRLSVKQVFLAVGILLGALLLFHGPLILGWQHLCGGDTINNFLPMRDQQLRHGWFAGWTPETYAGYPTMDNIQSGVFYPPNWVHVLWHYPERVITLLMMMHLLISGAGMFCLLRRWCGPGAAIFGAVVWISGGYQLGRIASGITVFTEALAWLPWMILAAECQTWRAGIGRAWVGALGLIGGLQLLTGAPQIAQITWVGLGLWTIGRLVAARRCERLDIVKGFLLAAFIAVLIAWPMLIGALRIQAESWRRISSDSLDFLYTDSVLWHHLLLWIAPNYFVPPNFEGLYWGGSTGWWEVSGYIGAGMLILGLSGFVVFGIGWQGQTSDERRLTLTLLFLGLFGFLVALGAATPLFPILAAYVPTFGLFRVPGRWCLWTVVAFLIVGCRLLDRLGNPVATPLGPVAVRSAGAAIGFCLVAILALWLAQRPLLLAMQVPQGERGIDTFFGPHASRAMMLALLGAVGTLLALSLVKRKAFARYAIPLALLFTLAEMRTAWQPVTIPIGTPFHPQAPETDTPHHRCPADRLRAHFYPDSPLAGRIRAQEGRTHYTDSIIGFFYNQDMPEMQTERPASLGLLVTRGYQQLRLADYVKDYYTGNSATTVGMNSPFLSTMDFNDRRFLDAFNVTLILAHPAPGNHESWAALGLEHQGPAGPPNLEAWRNPSARGWAWLSDNDAFLDAEPGGSGLGDVQIEEINSARWGVTVKTQRGAWLHLSSPDYSGWKLRATSSRGEVIEGESSRSIFLSGPESWRVERQFDRIGLRLGNLMLALLGITAALGLMVNGKRQNSESLTEA